jgi:hypothetical protein
MTASMNDGPIVAGQLRTKPKGAKQAKVCPRCGSTKCLHRARRSKKALTPDELKRMGQLDKRVTTGVRIDLPADTMRALTAAATPEALAAVELPEGEIPWSTPNGLMLVDTPTGDGRMFMASGYSVDTLPLTLTFNHDEENILGRMIECDTTASPESPPMCSGVFDDTPEARNYARHVALGNLKSISADLRVTEYEVEFTEDEDGFIIDSEFVAVRYSVAGASVVTIPGFEPCQIAIDAVGPESEAPAPEPMLTARPLRAAGGPVRPPRSAFEMPEPDELTPWTISDDGQYGYGHLAPWPNGDGHTGCHIGASDVCLCAEPSQAGNAYFLVGDMLCDDGSHIAVGAITLSGGHAFDDGRVPLDEVTAHYDNTDSAAVYVNVINGKLGPWACGVVRAGISEEDLQALRAASPSVHEREIAGNLELVRVCMVNTPGLPVLRASGGPLADFPQPRARLGDDGRVIEQVSVAGARALAAKKAKMLAPPSRAEFDTLRSDADRLESKLDDALRAIAALEPDLRERALARIG